MADKTLNFIVEPNKSPVYFVDSYLIGSNENAVTFNFAQTVAGSDQQNIVARVALTAKQAKEFVANLNDHINKFEV